MLSLEWCTRTLAGQWLTDPRLRGSRPPAALGHTVVVVWQVHVAHVPALLERTDLAFKSNLLPLEGAGSHVNKLSSPLASHYDRPMTDPPPHLPRGLRALGFQCHPRETIA